MAGRYFARSASDQTDDWPYWFVVDCSRSNLNVTVELMPELWGHLPFLSRDMAEELARVVNDPASGSD
ncbi:hypothetical protein [Nitrobacter sp. TKz-YC02]|uniref:hypothetical protein n=1 Tax=Nitrobacter sp. TKz-YC02 TaxID=3398704 RepID=UPI003CEC5EE8